MSNISSGEPCSIAEVWEYIYIYMYVCVCVYIYIYIFFFALGTNEAKLF